jgi:hypothetical protein
MFQPVLIAFAAGVALVGARIYTGRGGALIAFAYFLAIRGIVTILVGPVAGEATPHIPLYLAEAGIVELVALWIGTRRSYRFGAVSGLLIALGVVGLANASSTRRLYWPDTESGDPFTTDTVDADHGRVGRQRCS